MPPSKKSVTEPATTDTGKQGKTPGATEARQHHQSPVQPNVAGEDEDTDDGGKGRGNGETKEDVHNSSVSEFSVLLNDDNEVCLHFKYKVVDLLSLLMKGDR